MNRIVIAITSAALAGMIGFGSGALLTLPSREKTKATIAAIRAEANKVRQLQKEPDDANLPEQEYDANVIGFAFKAKERMIRDRKQLFEFMKGHINDMNPASSPQGREIFNAIIQMVMTNLQNRNNDIKALLGLLLTQEYYDATGRSLIGTIFLLNHETNKLLATMQRINDDVSQLPQPEYDDGDDNRKMALELLLEQYDTALWMAGKEYTAKRMLVMNEYNQEAELLKLKLDEDDYTLEMFTVELTELSDEYDEKAEQIGKEYVERLDELEKEYHDILGGRYTLQIYQLRKKHLKDTLQQLQEQMEQQQKVSEERRQKRFDDEQKLLREMMRNLLR